MTDYRCYGRATVITTMMSNDVATSTDAYNPQSTMRFILVSAYVGASRLLKLPFACVVSVWFWEHLAIRSAKHCKALTLTFDLDPTQ